MRACSLTNEECCRVLRRRVIECVSAAVVLLVVAAGVITVAAARHAEGNLDGRPDRLPHDDSVMRPERIRAVVAVTNRALGGDERPLRRQWRGVTVAVAAAAVVWAVVLAAVAWRTTVWRERLRPQPRRRAPPHIVAI